MVPRLKKMKHCMEFIISELPKLSDSVIRRGMVEKPQRNLISRPAAHHHAMVPRPNLTGDRAHGHRHMFNVSDGRPLDATLPFRRMRPTATPPHSNIGRVFITVERNSRSRILCMAK
jgi:hypothetical protein